jgi:hypothetical protein
MQPIRYCPFCGEQQHRGTRFCPKCGNQYPFAEDAADEDTRVAPAMAPAADVETAAAPPRYARPPRRPRRSRYPAVPLLLAGIVGAVALGYGLYRVGVSYLDTRRPDPAAEPAPVLAASPTRTEGSPVGMASPSPSPVVINPSTAPAIGQARVANTDGQGANLRQRPSTTAPVVKLVPDGTTVDVIGADQPSEGRVWRNVREPGGSTGWVAAELLAGE